MTSNEKITLLLVPHDLANDSLCQKLQQYLD